MHHSNTGVVPGGESRDCMCACCSVVVVATVCRPRELSAGVMAAFVHQVVLEIPTEEQRRTMLVGLSRELHLGTDVNLERLARLTAVREQQSEKEPVRIQTRELTRLLLFFSSSSSGLCVGGSGGSAG